MNKEQIEQTAEMCHEANAAWCLINIDNSTPTWRGAPQWQKDTIIMGVEFHLKHPDANASASHVSWMTHKLKDGWVYGEIKDPEAKTHPCIVDFKELPLEQRMKDHIFRGIVHAMREGFA